MEYTPIILPEIDFRSGLIACTGISHNDHAGEKHADIIKRFNEFEPNLDGSANIYITENTLRNWLYRNPEHPENFIPRWDIVFKLCRLTKTSLSEILGIHRKERDWTDLIDLSQESIEILEKLNECDFSHFSYDYSQFRELKNTLPRNGAMISFILRDKFFSDTIIPLLEEYNNQLDRIANYADKYEYKQEATIAVLSEIHKNRLIRKIQPNLIEFVHRFSFELKSGNEFTAYDTTPFCISNDIVDPRKAFQIGINLAVYHNQNPEDVRYGAKAILGNEQTLPPVNIRKIHRDLNEYINNHSDLKKYIIDILYPSREDIDTDAFNEEFIAYSSVHGWISGKFIPKPLFLRILCAFFSCDIDYLFGGQRFPQYEYDIIDRRTGLTNVFCQWLCALPAIQTYCVEYLVSCRSFLQFINKMQQCFLPYYRANSQMFGSLAVKRELLSTSRLYGDCLYRLTEHTTPFSQKFLNLARVSCGAIPTETGDKFEKSQCEDKAFTYSDDEESLIIEYALSMLPEQFTECFSDVLYAIQNSYLMMKTEDES